MSKTKKYRSKNNRTKKNKFNFFNLNMFKNKLNIFKNITNPDPIQIVKLLTIPPKTEFFIINLIKFKNPKVYHEYARWAEKLMKPYGIKRVTNIMDIKFTLIGQPHNEFDEAFIVKYPSIDAAKKYGEKSEADPIMLNKRKEGIKYAKLLVAYPSRKKF